MRTRVVLGRAGLAAAATAVNVPIALMAAFALARFHGREAIQTILLAPLIVPAVVTGIAILRPSRRRAGATR